ncbi:phage head-tail connector protein [Lachnoclostridium sp. Marseille-P6806]|uniref:phage head-tail connector protein n=1 Tax=Lachnoclostridium sp. Marseille-P6806 TaxID=2364793 RepID=UPI001F5F39C5|nr:hypothetical protein [Lachnoclostridium sp. Marseille-P6806]
MIDSILDSVKLNLGILPEYTAFDQQLLMSINTAFSVLHQLGIGPKDGYEINDNSTTWAKLIPKPRLNMIRSYVFLKVKLLFDPPTTSFLLDAYKQQLQEMEWRIRSEIECST